MSVNRRQNASCDPCRRSKRRCTIPNNERRDGQSCSNCLNLGHRCTFAFAKARAKERRNTGSSLSTTAIKKHGKSFDITTESAILAQPCDSPTTISSAPTTRITSPENETKMARLYVEAFFNEFDPGLSDFGLSRTFGNEIYTEASKNHEYHSPTLLDNSFENMEQESFWFDTSPSATTSRFLNSSFALKSMTQWMSAVNNQMITEIASRYLHYNCNNLTGKTFYDLTDEDTDVVLRYPLDDPSVQSYNCNNHAQDGFQTGDFMYQHSNLPGSRVDNPHAKYKISKGENKMSLLSTAHMLDMFGDLYDNKIDSFDRRSDEAMLAAVMQAFALQWLPSNDFHEPQMAEWLHYLENKSSLNQKEHNSPPTPMAVFLQAWFNARDQVLAVRSRRSFVALYAIFLFNITVIPTEASQADRKQLGLVLDCGLKHLVELQRLVRDYCDCLGTGSTYRKLLRSSLTVFHWFGYVRDTVASFTTERMCILQQTEVRANGGPAGGEVHSMAASLMSDDEYDPLHGSLTILSGSESVLFELDHNIAAICREAASALFSFWRLVLHLRSLLDKSNSDGTFLGSDIRIVIHTLNAAVEAFDSKYGPALKQCLKRFTQLSAQSRMGSAFVLMFWSLGLFVLGHEIGRGLSLDMSLNACRLRVQIRTYESTGVDLMAFVASCIINLPREHQQEPVPGLSDRLPLLTHHANMSLVVVALTQGIQTALRLQSDHESRANNGESIPDQNTSRSKWSSAVRTMMKCLVSVKSTVSGANLVSNTMKNLVRQHGDVILDCWLSQN